MATAPPKRTKQGVHWTPSEDVWISEKDGISRARDAKTGQLRTKDNGSSTPARPPSRRRGSK